MSCVYSSHRSLSLKKNRIVRDSLLLLTTNRAVNVYHDIKDHATEYCRVFQTFSGEGQMQERDKEEKVCLLVEDGSSKALVALVLTTRWGWMLSLYCFILSLRYYCHPVFSSTEQCCLLSCVCNL